MMTRSTEQIAPMTWAQILPWLEHLAAGHRRALIGLGEEEWWVHETPGSTLARLEDLDAIYGELAHLLQQLPMKHETFAVLLPRLPAQTGISALDLGTRARTVLSREKLWSLGAVRSWHPAKIVDLPGVGHNTVQEILTELLRAAVQGPRLTDLFDQPHIPSVADEGIAPGTVTTPSSAPPCDAWATVRDDLSALASYGQAFARNATLFDLIANPHVLPSSTRRAAQSLAQTTVASLRARRQIDTPASELQQWFQEMDVRTRTIVQHRLVSPSPARLGDLGEQFNISRERVRQLENKVIEEYRDLRSGSNVINDAIDLLLRAIGALTTAVHLTQQLPWLSNDVFDGTASVLTALLALDDVGFSRGEWVATRDVNQVIATTRQKLDLHRGAVMPLSRACDAIAELHLPSDATRAWLTECGYRVYGQTVGYQDASVADKALMVLTEVETPLETEAIIDQIGEGYAVTSLKNALSIDDRFIRADRNSWALSAWDIRAYTSIRELIDDAITDGGGAIQMTDLIANLTRSFTVAESSIRAYASAYPFALADGWVRRTEAPRVARRTMVETRHCFWNPDGWTLRIEVTAEHVRGSGFVVPGAVAGLIGCAAGDKKTLDTPTGSVRVAWTGLQPVMSSIRHPLECVDAEIGDLVFLRFVLPDKLQIIVVPRSRLTLADGLQRAAMLAGYINASPASACHNLCASIKTDNATSVQTLATLFRNRRDDDIADLLDADVSGAIGTTEIAPYAGISDRNQREFVDLLGMDTW